MNGYFDDCYGPKNNMNEKHIPFYIEKSLNKFEIFGEFTTRQLCERKNHQWK